MKRKLYILFLLCCAAVISAAQNTMIVGQVYDLNSGLPIPNVNLTIQGTSFGTSSGPEGYYVIRCNLNKKYTLVASCIGYKSQRIPLEPGQSGAMDIALEERTTLLADLFVTPGANPALPLMDRVRANRPYNYCPVDTTEVDYETSLYVSNIGSRQLHRKFWKGLEVGLIEQEDSTCLLPIYHRLREHGQTRTRVTMLTEQDYDMMMSDIQIPKNFYNNSVVMYDQNFISPLASNGNTYYQYYLVDSLESDHHDAKQYIVHFKSKNPFGYSFDGQMIIDSASAALIRIEASVVKQSSANFLRSGQISQTFDSLTHTLIAEDKMLLLDMAVKMDSSRILPTILVQQHSAVVPASSSASSSASASSSVWAVDTAMLSQAETKIEELNHTPLMRTAQFLAKTILTAYIPTGTCIDVGNGADIIDMNKQELVRVALPFRTNEKLMKNVSLEAYVAYGFKDTGWKGKGAVHVQIPGLRRNIMHFQYTDAYIYSDWDYFDRYKRENINWCKDMNMGSRFTRGFTESDPNTFNAMVRNREFLVESENDWTDHLETITRLSVGRRGYDEPILPYTQQPSYRFASLATTFRLGWQERKVDLYFQRVHVYSNMPVLFLNAEIGSYQTDAMSTYDMYGKLRLMLRQQVNLGVAGRLDYLVEGGLILGKVPYNMLHIFQGCQSWGYNLERFSLLYNYSFAGDRYLQLMGEWNGKGCLFNLIPGIRYLRLRELVVFKAGWSGMSDKHQSVLALPTMPDGSQRMQAAQVPYIEMGFGLGNIFRVANLYSIWRLTHRQDPLGQLWAIRFMFKIES